ncbi:MAG TPA: hypothetical protein VFE32_11800 [Puia sp.]|jgi:hypothetical protein|nr:hypothetical protein [Puia sp.]
MNNSTKSCADTDLRSLLKQQHKTVYSICRLFARSYKEHQRLFMNILAAASQNIRFRKSGDVSKQTMLWRACINMAALHSITSTMELAPDREIKFKSPDYQRSMAEFSDSIGNSGDYDKFMLFIDFEKIDSDDLFGSVNRTAPQHTGPVHFIPYLKEKLIWS